MTARNSPHVSSFHIRAALFILVQKNKKLSKMRSKWAANQFCLIMKRARIINMHSIIQAKTMPRVPFKTLTLRWVSGVWVERVWGSLSKSPGVEWTQLFPPRTYTWTLSLVLYKFPTMTYPCLKETEGESLASARSKHSRDVSLVSR